MNTLLIILRIFPCTRSRPGGRAGDPAARPRQKELDLVLDVLKSAYDAGTDLSASFSWEKLLTVVVPMIAKIVDLHNALGLFQKPVQAQ